MLRTKPCSSWTPGPLATTTRSCSTTSSTNTLQLPPRRVAGHWRGNTHLAPSRRRAAVSAAASRQQQQLSFNQQQQQQQLWVQQQAAVQQQQQQPTVTLTGLVAALALAATALVAAAATCFMLYLRPVIQAMSLTLAEMEAAAREMQAAAQQVEELAGGINSAVRTLLPTPLLSKWTAGSAGASQDGGEPAAAATTSSSSRDAASDSDDEAAASTSSSTRSSSSSSTATASTSAAQLTEQTLESLAQLLSERKSGRGVLQKLQLSDLLTTNLNSQQQQLLQQLLGLQLRLRSDLAAAANVLSVLLAPASKRSYDADAAGDQQQKQPQQMQASSSSSVRRRRAVQYDEWGLPVTGKAASAAAAAAAAGGAAPLAPEPASSDAALSSSDLDLDLDEYVSFQEADHDLPGCVDSGITWQLLQQDASLRERVFVDNQEAALAQQSWTRPPTPNAAAAVQPPEADAPGQLGRQQPRDGSQG